MRKTATVHGPIPLRPVRASSQVLPWATLSRISSERRTISAQHSARRWERPIVRRLTGSGTDAGDGDRIRLPARFVELTQIRGTHRIDCWLLVVTPGRYRLLPQLTAESEEAEGLARLLREIGEAALPGNTLDGTSSNERAALAARLIPTVASPIGKNWRLTVPKEVRMLVHHGDDQSFLFILFIAGFIELWFPDTLRRAVSAPISKILA
jgi:hypothetical protein